MSKKKSVWGGKRSGAGRKAQPQSRVIPKSIRVSVEVSEYLRSEGTGIVEDTVRRSKGFKDWQRGQR